MNADGLRAQLATLERAGGPLEVDDAGWAWAYPLVNQADMAGHLVVSRDTEPEPHHQFLLNVLVQQTGVALANARLHARERASTERERETAARERATADQLRAANLALERAATELALSSAAVQRSLAIHNRLTAVTSAREGQDGIVRAVHDLTGLPVAIEDRHGNFTAWAGPGRPDPYPKPTTARREQTLQRAVEAGVPVRDRGRLIALAQQGSEVLGVIALVDPNRTAGDSERVALEHGTTVLTLELAHLRALGEVELRLRRDLVEELLAGTDAQSAKDRARALGYDLARSHRVVLVANGSQRTDHEAFFHAVRRAVRGTGVGSLLVARSGGVAGQAQLALKMQVATRSPDQVTVFEDLGVYRLLSEIANIGSVESFIHRWLGALLDYDATKGAQLVEALSGYLECGGNYDLTAKALSLHRSTLRYRLQRIRDVSGHGLNHPDARFNLQLATRAWTTVHAMRQQP